MLNLSEVLIQNPQLESFEQLEELIETLSKEEMFFRIDVKPQFGDTPGNWEDRLEAKFT
ncbi:sulfur relay protein DsrC [Ectothiorhodospiraceae bacterium BW-2]|nr:sulfur relay protein DsrC [Ectothiorhodospiraceae bacterium BW-2]